MRSGWYVVQVETGREDLTLRLMSECEHLIPEDERGAIDEAFAPKIRTLSKVDGDLVEGEQPLLPGYVIVAAKREALPTLEALLRRVPKFTRMLKTDEVFTPLSQVEASWIDQFTKRGRRTIDMSSGYVRKGMLVVTSGPLVGKEFMVKKVNRRKRFAVIEMNILGRTVETKLGLSLTKAPR